jgi:hypothetical protein
VGKWFSRTREYAARLRGEDFGPYDYAEDESLTLAKLPCWEHLSDDAYRERIQELVQEVESEAAAERERTGRAPLGREAILKQQPTARPAKTKKSPAPLFHVIAKAVRRRMYEAWALFLAAYRDAAEKLRNGDLTAVFPEGCFPPPQLFVGVPWPAG